MPKGSEEALGRVANARITTGFTRNDTGGDAFKAYFEANVHAPSVFAVFRDLAYSLLPDVAVPIIGLKDEEPAFGPYTDRNSAIEVFEPHRDLLQNDGFLEFGITFQYQGRVEEIFVKSAKYFQIWTNQPEIVDRIFDQNGIPFVPDLQFIDEYPMVSKSINSIGNAVWPGVYEAVKVAFDNLPAPVADQ